MYGHNLTETGIFAMRCPVFILHILILLAFLAFPSITRAETAPKTLYQITGIEVDVTAKTAAAARTLAIETAERKAFEQLAEQFQASLPTDKINNADIGALVQNFDVEQEKFSATRVIGRYTVQFRPAATRRYFDKLGVNYIEKMPDSVLVLPVTHLGKRFILWEEPTPWRGTWESGNRKRDSLIIPTGDLEDVKIISTNEAIGGKAASLHALIEKYSAKGGAVVTILTPATNKDSGKLESSFYDADGDYITTETTQLDPVAADTKPEARYADLAGDLRKSIAAHMKETKNNSKEGGAASVSEEIPTGTEKPNAPPHETLAVTTTVNSLPEWAMIKRQIDSLPMVDNTILTTITRGSAKFDLTYHGDLRNLQSALSDQNMALGQSGEKGDWLLMIEQPAGVKQ